jgi:hypothetical protein
VAAVLWALWSGPRHAIPNVGKENTSLGFPDSASRSTGVVSDTGFGKASAL